jgi:hypothetical protein
MKVNFLLKTFILGLSIVLLASCDKDFNEIGVSVVGDDHYGFEKFVDPSVVAYNRNLGVVQTNNLPINALGIYDNPVFGKTTSSFVTQVQLNSVNPTFYEPVLEDVADSVYLYIPYYYTANTDGSIKKLDSIYGGNSKFKLKLYESNKYLQSLDPNDNLQTNLKYYSDQSSDFNSSIASIQLNNSSKVEQNEEFYFKSNIIDIKKDDVVVRRLAPGMFLELDKAFFLNKILNAPAGKLLNNNIFKEYFRGLYFKAESNGVDSGSMGMLNFAAGTITIAYKDYANATAAAAAVPGTKVRKNILLKLTGNTVNLHENTNNATNGDYQAAISATTHPATGDEKLYLKGQQGSMVVIELFGGQTNANSTLLNQIRNEKWLINEANLTFHIDSDAMGNTPEPNRIYLYDLNNSQPIADYNFDVSTNSTNSKLDKASFGGIIQKDSDNRGTKYKVRLTHHLRNLVKNIDSTNVRLGLVVTEDITKPQNYFLKNSFTIGTNTTKYTPYMSIVNPLGTVLYGTNSSLLADERRLKLEIYYTKPD